MKTQMTLLAQCHQVTKRIFVKRLIYNPIHICIFLMVQMMNFCSHIVLAFFT